MHALVFRGSPREGLFLCMETVTAQPNIPATAYQPCSENALIKPQQIPQVSPSSAEDFGWNAGSERGAQLHPPLGER